MKILGKTTLRKGSKFDIAIHTLEASSGERFEREFIDHPGAVVLVPLLEDGQVVLIRNYRHAVDRFLLEVPAGTAKIGEPFDVTAHRELEEETGFQATTIERILDFYPCPGASGERMVVYRCTGLKAGPPQREVDEEMEVEIVPFDDALAMIDDGRIIDGKTIISLWKVARDSGFGSSMNNAAG